MSILELLSIVILASMLIVALIYIFSVISPIVLNFVSYQILKLCIRTPAKNTVTGDTTEQRIREFKCRQLGCVTTAEYYVCMPQATCRRCGHKNSCAQPQVPEWRLPD